MKKIVAINCSPRSGWNTATLVREAAKGAEGKGAEVTVIDLYKLEKFTGCISCFGGKRRACKRMNRQKSESQLLVDMRCELTKGRG